MTLPALPDLLREKLTKTGSTRGASDREIFQNRVRRNNTVLIDYRFWAKCQTPDDGTSEYESGFLVLVEPSWYFETEDSDSQLRDDGLELGANALLLFRRRHDWEKYHRKDRLANGRPLSVATARRNPLGGTYMARIHGTVAGTDGEKVSEGFSTSRLRGAGIRVFEYASRATIADAELQLEALIWLCEDAEAALQEGGMKGSDVSRRKRHQMERAEARGLLDHGRLRRLRVVDGQGRTICPLCRIPMLAADFFKRGEQAEGREVYDLTVTEVGLFHIQELRIGKLQHKTYNLGWGHHFCNVVVKDEGIPRTLQWMRHVLDNQAGAANLEEVAASVEAAVEQ